MCYKEIRNVTRLRWLAVLLFWHNNDSAAELAGLYQGGSFCYKCGSYQGIKSDRDGEFLKAKRKSTLGAIA